MIAQEWENLEKKYSNIILHDFVVMPNHFHGIIEIKNENEKTMENENVGANLVFALKYNKTHTFLQKIMIRFNPDIHKRSSLRLKNYDYSQNGLYFITIAVQNKLCLF